MSAKLARLALNPHSQNIEHIQQIVKTVLGRAGCISCGRMLRLEIEFLGDPPDELGKLPGVISVDTVGI